MSALDRATTEYLRALKQRGVQLGLQRMRRFAEALGDPQDRVPVIHVAGTNGKGSVAAMVERIFRAAGWKTGLYTSPHLVRLGERIQVDRHPLSAAALAEHVAAMRPVVDACIARDGLTARPSFFEFLTAMAFRHFARQQCDIAIVEVGMGGRLDATNVVAPEVSVITSIGLDHCEFLGSTVEAIAAEKAGIIKPHRPVVIGRLPGAAEHVVRGVAATNRAPVVSVREAWGDRSDAYPQTNLAGEYQRLNAGTATLVARQLDARWRIDETVVTAALLDVDWPGRWQRVSVGDRWVVIDASHNEEGAAALERNLQDLQREAKQQPVVVTGVLGAHRAKPLLEVICRYAREVHLVIPAQSRACTYEQLEGLMPASFRGPVVRRRVEDVFPDPQHCVTREGDRAPLVVTGSIYLAGEVLARLDPSRGPIEHELQDF